MQVKRCALRGGEEGVRHCLVEDLLVQEQAEQLAQITALVVLVGPAALLLGRLAHQVLDELVLCREGGGVGEIWERCGGGMGEVWGRSGGDLGKHSTSAGKAGWVRVLWGRGRVGSGTVG